MDVLAEIFALLTNLWEYYVAFIFFTGFMDERQIKKEWCFGYGIFFSVVLYYVNLFKIPAINTACCLFLIFLLAMFVCKGSILKKAAFSIIFITISVAAEMLCGFTFMIASAINISRYMNHPVTYIVGGIISKLLLQIIVHILLRDFNKKHYSDNPVDLIVLSVFPTLAVIAMLLVIHITSSLVLAPIQNLFVIILILGLLSSGVVVFFAYDNSMYKIELKNELMLEKETLKMSEIMFRQLKEHIDELNGTKHDFKNHLINIINLCEQKRFVEMRQYYDQLIVAIDSNDITECIDFNNFVMSNIFAGLAKECRDCSIMLNFDIQFNDFAFLSVSDTGTLFDNIFDNALSACRLKNDDRWITVLIKKINQFALIIVENSKVNKIVNTDKGFFSTHRDYKEIGYGISNIQKAAEKYDGYATTDFTDDKFSITVRLKVTSDQSGAR